MSELSDKIAEFIGLHEHWDRGGGLGWECACGRSFGLKVNLDHHIADVISNYVRGHVVNHAEELGMEAEHGAQHPIKPDGTPKGWYGGRGPDMEYARIHNWECAMTDADELGTHVLTRYVTDWVRDEHHS